VTTAAQHRLIGEAGPEAIIPLSQLPSLMDRMGGGGGGGVKVDVHVHGSNPEEIIAQTTAAVRHQMLLSFRNDKRVRDAIGDGQRGSLHA
jgi:hypothetical protein